MLLMRGLKDLTWCSSVRWVRVRYSEPLTIDLLKSACLHGAAPRNDVDSLARWSFGLHHGLDPLLSHGERRRRLEYPHRMTVHLGPFQRHGLPEWCHNCVGHYHHNDALQHH